MFIRKVKIDGFGKLIDREFIFTPGMNIVSGPNESGKTTLAKFMLYTLSGPHSESLKFKPWNSEKFGGIMETSEGNFTFGQTSEKNYEKSTLESIAFLMEDDDLENFKVDKSIIESSLRKKSERTEKGRIIKSTIQRLEELKLDKCILKLSDELEAVERQIQQIKQNIDLRNKLILEMKGVSKLLEETKSKLLAENEKLEALRKERQERLLKEIKRLKDSIEEIKLELSKLRWIEQVDQNTIFEISALILKIENLKTELDKLSDEEKALAEIIEAKSENVNSKLKILNVTSEEDLEHVSLRLKHLSLLSKMYGEGIQQTNTEDPLWQIFMQDPQLIERAEDEEQKYQETKNIIEKEKNDLQIQIEKTESRAKYLKDISLVSALAGIVLLTLGLLFSKISIFMYSPSLIFNGLAILFWVKSKSNAAKLSVLQERLVEITIKQPERPQIWKLLLQYNIKDLKDLRKKYSEFIEWKASNFEKQKKLIELKEIEQEIIKELAKFNVNGYAQMIVSAVENLQKTFKEVQELIYEKESLARKLEQIRNDKVSKQKELKMLIDNLEQMLRSVNVKRQDVESYRQRFEEYQSLKTLLSEYTVQLKNLQSEMENEDSDKQVYSLKSNLEALKKQIEELTAEIDHTSERLKNVYVDKEALQALLVKKDEIKFKISLVATISSYIPKIHEYLKENYSNFVESYHKSFSDEFTRFFNYVSAQPRNFLITPELSIKILVEGDLEEPSKYLSGSTKDLLIFGIKIALYKAFYNDNIPLVIDNTLIRFDDDRLKKVCDFLKKESNYRQIILLTSDKRILDYLGNVASISYLEG
jgi:DNA repair exonuclease SbcCD ATPase subunit